MKEIVDRSLLAGQPDRHHSRVLLLLDSRLASSSLSRILKLLPPFMYVHPTPTSWFPLSNLFISLINKIYFYVHQIIFVKNKFDQITNIFNL
jgi:hypothetical protein